MTELETIQRAKMYLSKLAQGIDPISDTKISEDSVFNQTRLAWCFFYVSGVLQQVICRRHSHRASQSFQIRQSGISYHAGADFHCFTVG